MLLIQDRSGSMTEDENGQSCNLGCGANSKWSQLTLALNSVVQDSPTEDAAVENAVADAVAQGIKTFVIGIGNVATAESTLNALAIAGGEAQVGASTSYYPTTDESALETALNTVLAAVACP